MRVLSNTRLLNIAILQFSILVLSITGIIAKKASLLPFGSVDFIMLYALEIFVIGIYAIIWQQVIKRFDLSVAYANKGMLIIWTFVWAWLLFGETITLNNLIGAVLIITGIIMVFHHD
ncbi:MAG: EamA family transporter [Syntrophomonas sp.]